MGTTYNKEQKAILYKVIKPLLEEYNKNIAKLMAFQYGLDEEDVLKVISMKIRKEKK